MRPPDTYTVIVIGNGREIARYTDLADVVIEHTEVDATGLNGQRTLVPNGEITLTLKPRHHG